MSLPPESLQVIDDTQSRLATEYMLAQPGRDDGLMPAYALLGTLREACAGAPALAAPLAEAQQAVERLLDGARPFDAETLARLGRLLAWLPDAVAAVRAGREPAACALPPAAPAAAAAAGPAGAAPAGDALMELNLGDNRELLGEFHAEVVDHLQQIEAALLVLDQQPAEPEALNSIFRSFHTIKGNAGFLGLTPMHTLAHEVESLLDLARNHALRLTPAIITEVLRSRDALQVLTQQVADALERGRVPDQVVPVSHLIRAVRALARPDAASAAPEPGPAVPAAVPAPVAVPVSTEPEAAPDASPAASTARAAAKPASAAQTVRVSTEKLDSLMDVVGELVIVQSQLIESAQALAAEGTPMQRNVAQLSRIAKELQHTAMSLRMIPIKPTFQKMERLARDLAQGFGKRVAFLVSGEETELDRTMVEEIADPLVHMVRNALDHGLEQPEVRAAAGKPEQGTVHLRAFHQGGHIVIELADDGRGIDPDRIRAKAVERGLIAPDAVLTREETFALIFAPGFSTAEKVTAVSGRGVGMDVVKRNIDKLRGKIEILSEVGQGSTFRIKLPLTMAIIDGLVVRVGADRFILPSTSVQMAYRPARDAIHTVQGAGEVVDLRGRILPLHRLHRRFGVAADATQPWEGILVIVEHSGRVSALLVDEMVSKQEVVIKNLGAYLSGLPGISGGAILGDGNIALILDPVSLLSAA